MFIVYNFFLDRCEKQIILLGKGTFNSIYRVNSLRNTNGFAHTVGNNGKPQHELVIKRLHYKTLSSRKATEVAEYDLSVEAAILSKLPFHKNIIRLHGISEDFYTCPRKGFLVLDFLQSTLQEQLDRWRRRSHLNKKSRLCPFQGSELKKQLLQQERERIYKFAVGIACAMEFLHANRIIYRDLKPHNIGFDQQENVTLFDFGLARSMEPETQERRMTGMTGTFRYMAPEVVQSKDYSYPADVYSFAILLWEVCSLSKPFPEITSLKKLKKRVVLGHCRPSFNKICSSGVKELLKSCWQSVPEHRKSFSHILGDLELLVKTKEGKLHSDETLGSSDVSETMGSPGVSALNGLPSLDALTN